MRYLLEGYETKRMKLRPLEEGDRIVWADFFAREGVAGFVGLAHITDPKEQCDLWFEKVFERYTNNLGGLNALISKETGRLLGQAGLLVQELDGETILEVGYSILPEHWNQGYAKEAALACRNYAFANNFTDALHSIIHVDNKGSMKVARANGMKVIKSTVFKNMPVNIFRITKAEWMDLEVAS